LVAGGDEEGVAGALGDRGRIAAAGDPQNDAERRERRIFLVPAGGVLGARPRFLQRRVFLLDAVFDDRVVFLALQEQHGQLDFLLPHFLEGLLQHLRRGRRLGARRQQLAVGEDGAVVLL